MVVTRCAGRGRREIRSSVGPRDRPFHDRRELRRPLPPADQPRHPWRERPERCCGARRRRPAHGLRRRGGRRRGRVLRPRAGARAGDRHAPRRRRPGSHGTYHDHRHAGGRPRLRFRGARRQRDVPAVGRGRRVPEDPVMGARNGPGGDRRGAGVASPRRECDSRTTSTTRRARSGSTPSPRCSRWRSCRRRAQAPPTRPTWPAMPSPRSALGGRRARQGRMPDARGRHRLRAARRACQGRRHAGCRGRARSPASSQRCSQALRRRSRSSRGLARRRPHASTSAPGRRR